MTTDPNRKLYQRLKAREYRAKKRANRVVIALASAKGSISLLKAGIQPGTYYVAVPQDGGAILLTPTETKESQG
jgi:hypothetical protein